MSQVLIYFFFLLLFNAQLVLANPGSEIMKKLDNSKVLEGIGHEWIFLTVAEAVSACNFMLHTQKQADSNGTRDNLV